MSTFSNAIQGIKHIKDPEVLKGLQDIKDKFYQDRSIPKGIKLDDRLRHELSELWADYLIEVGGNINGTVRD